MKKTLVALVVSIWLAFLGLMPCSDLNLLAADTVFFVVRHAEKADETNDPHLSSAGAKRAEQLMQALENLRVDGIYTTAFRRTNETAQALATKRQLTPITYADPTKTWIDSIVAVEKGKRVLVVGHSDTVDVIINRL